jgi:hypothetical protein
VAFSVCPLIPLTTLITPISGQQLTKQYLYAFVSTLVASSPNRSPIPDAPHHFGHKEDQIPACYGTKCFSFTLWIAAGCCVISGLGMFVVGRRWKV